MLEEKHFLHSQIGEWIICFTKGFSTLQRISQNRTLNSNLPLVHLNCSSICKLQFLKTSNSVYLRGWARQQSKSLCNINITWVYSTCGKNKRPGDWNRMTWVLPLALSLIYRQGDCFYEVTAPLWASVFSPVKGIEGVSPTSKVCCED